MFSVGRGILFIRYCHHFLKAGFGKANFGKTCANLCLAVVLAANGLAQDASLGALQGTVSDGGGARLAGALVALLNLDTAARYSATSDADGHFAFDLLPPGDYSARAVANGMSPQVTPRLHVWVGGATQIDFKLSVAGVKETITVSGDAQLVETQPAAVSAVIDERAIRELPLDGRRFTDLALLTPGVTQDPRGLTSGSNGDLAFGGIRGFQSSYLVDGADNNNAFFAQARGRYRAPYQFSNEVVQEFRVSSNTYGAELGRSGGAVVNVVTKSGSNQMHGSAFYFLRDGSFGATQPTLNFKPSSHQHQFGFTLGGPLRRNRVFFFAGLDQHIFHVPTIVRFLDGRSQVIPQAGQEPLHDGDYEESDRALVFAKAAQLSGLAGLYPSQLLGNAGFFKLDTTLSAHNSISARLSTSRYYGQNNVFLDPASPLTTFGISENGEEEVSTESGALTLTSGISSRLVSHLRAQYSRDLQQSVSNSLATLTKIPSVIDGFGRSNILPRHTREGRLHFTETLSLEGRRHSWKLGGDALLTTINNFFPAQFGGEYLFDPIKVDPFTFQPQEAGLELTPLRAYAHEVPRYYIQNFGSAISHPDTNEYAGFLQDTIRVSNRLAISLGVRYDLQTYTKKGLVSNPLWPNSGKVPYDPRNFAPRGGFAYSLGRNYPLVIRGGYGLFYTRIPQIYTSTIVTDNGLTGTSLFLDNANYYDRQVFPTYPNALVACSIHAASCTPPASLEQFVKTDISSFAGTFKTPHVEQSSVSVEKEIARRLAVGVSYLYVHGEALIRARDVNLPPPTDVVYPIYDAAGSNFLGQYYHVKSFSTWQLTRSFTCPYPPCINPLTRPIPQLGAINEFESEATSIYHGATLSIRRRMTHGLYFNVAYTFAHAIDDGQDALVAGRPATVQNSYAPKAERGPSVTDQRQRFVFSWIAEPHPFSHANPVLQKLFNDWKTSGVVTVGSGRPVNPTVAGDANQDGNSTNDRLPKAARNSFLGPDYASTDMRLTRRLYFGDRIKLDLIAESFNLLNRDNKRVQITEDGLQTNTAKFVKLGKQLGINYFPGHYEVPANLFKATGAYAPRQLQLALKMIF